MSLNKFLDRQRSKLVRDRGRSKGADVPNGTHLHHFFSDGDHIADAPKDDAQKTKAQQQIKDVKVRIAARKLDSFTDEDIGFALRLPFTSGAVEKTVTLLGLVQDAEHLIVRPYDPSVTFQGAVNRSAVSCYLDAILFAMFAYLSSFELMLVTKIEDKSRDHLAALIRLWVNIQRSGELVTTDITREIQLGLGQCGWKDATERRQQDALEAFTFILEQLGFPDLHLKMDIFHSGTEDEKDDHKIVRERVLAMPLPDPNPDGSPIKLEDCFELALIARIDVRRKYERERRATISSIRSPRMTDSQKMAAIQVEAVEVTPSYPNTPLSESQVDARDKPTSEPSEPPPPYWPSSFIQDREYFPDEKAVEAAPEDDPSFPRQAGRSRAQSLRKEVLMPAWQMYSLIPFHTGESPKNDAEVLQQVHEKRPTFCIALKRYSFGKDGVAARRDDHVDIPLDMAVPHFIQDNTSPDSDRLFQNFKISLQSLVCHRGTHVDSGHYISIVRVPASTKGSRWLLFDDLAEQRVKEVDIGKALREEMPYLLFYRVEPREILSTAPSETGESISATVAPSTAESEDIIEQSSLGRISSERSRGRKSTSLERPIALSVPNAGNAHMETPPVESSDTSFHAISIVKSFRSGSVASATNKSAPVSRQASILSGRPQARSRGSSAERLASPSAGRSAARARNRLSGLFSTNQATTASRAEAQLQSVKNSSNDGPAANSSTKEVMSEALGKSSIESKVESESDTVPVADESFRVPGRDKDREKGRRRLSAHGTRSRSKRASASLDRECLLM